MAWRADPDRQRRHLQSQAEQRAQGLEAASRPLVVLCDAGIALTADDLVTAAAQLSDDVGLVLALKAGERPENFAAEMECAYINGHQARFLLAATGWACLSHRAA